MSNRIKNIVLRHEKFQEDQKNKQIRKSRPNNRPVKITRKLTTDPCKICKKRSRKLGAARCEKCTNKFFKKNPSK